MKNLAWGAALALLGTGFSAASTSVPTPAAAVRPGQDYVLAGRVTDFVTGEPIGGARVVIKGVGRVTTRSNGRYRIKSGVDPAGAAVKVRANGYVRRNTWLPDPATDERRSRTRWNADLLPRNGDWNRSFVDTVLRTDDGTARWAQPPTFRVYTRQLACTTGPAAPGCDVWQATDQLAPDDMQQWFTTAVLEHVPLWTGGWSAPSEIEFVDPGAGREMTTDELLAPGYFTLIVHPDQAPLFVHPWPVAGATLSSELLVMNPHFVSSARRMALHVAFALGIRALPDAALCAQLFANGTSSYLCETHGLSAPSAFDELHGRFLYSRPPGNRAPDRDPPPDR